MFCKRLNGKFQLKVTVLIMGIIMVACVWCMLTGKPKQFVVGPDQTYKTISSALLEMNDGDVCIIKSGVYRESIDLKLNNIALRGDGHVFITGCDLAKGMETVEINGLKGLRKAYQGPVYDVFYAGNYMMLARFPNKSAPMTSNLDWEQSRITDEGDLEFPEQDPAVFAGVNDGYYVGMQTLGSVIGAWCSVTVPILGIDETGLIKLDARRAGSGYMSEHHGLGNGLGYIIGSKGVLDAPGEWYSNGREVIVIPPSTGEDTCEIRTRLYGAMISGSGVTLENIRFKAAAARIDGDDVTFKKCAFEFISPFRHVEMAGEDKTEQSLPTEWGIPENGTAGVYVKGDRFVAEDCRFSKSWWCGMMIRGSNARVENCLFEDVNWMAKRCAGLFCWGDHNVVRFCTLRNLGGAGIEGGNGMWVEQYAKNNIWEYNYIKDACKLIVDQGFFYVNHQYGSSPEANTIWRYNVGNGATGPEKGDWRENACGFYIDNSSSGYRVHNNIVINAERGLQYSDTEDGEDAGKNVIFYNNTLYRCKTVSFPSFGDSKVYDAEVSLVNNIAVDSGDTDLFTEQDQHELWKNNYGLLPDSVLKNPANMDFTPTDEKPKTCGIPVAQEPFSYVGAVDPKKGMWRYGADESRLLD